jgi:hypothetical protein
MREETVINSVSCGVQTNFIGTESNTKVTVYEKINDTTRFKLIQMVSLLMEGRTSLYWRILILIVTAGEYDFEGSCGDT